jgi:truncated hemoglobin YjbI
VNPAPADIVAREDISRLVAEFYWRVFTGELLGPVFLDVARWTSPCTCR